MRCLLAIWLGIFSTVAVAEEEDREVPLPFVTLVQPSKVPKLERTPLSDERVEEIEGLIFDLTKCVQSDLSLNSTYLNSKFVPVGEFGTFGAWTGKRVEATKSLRKLVEIGPDALPYLLEALDDDTPTEIVIQAVKSEGAIAGGMAFDEAMYGNPANPTEAYVLRLNRFPYSASIRPKDERFSVAPEMESYRIKVGDVCFVILGQIVSRKYVCLDSPHVKSSGNLVCSPVHRKAVRKQLQSIWKSQNPRQKVLESLILDFSTRGVLQMNSLDYWDIGNDFQIEAAKRLLYYYPEVGVPLIVNRIKNLQASDDFFDDCVKNGLRSDDFVDAIAWSTNGEIKSALADLGRRAKENDLIDALQRAGVTIPKGK